MPFASVIICTYNRQDRLILALEGVFPQILAEDAELIVVNNNSTDDTENVLEAFVSKADSPQKIITHRENKQGLSHARNTGISLSSGQIIIFLDDDAIPASTWLAACLSFFRDNPTAAAAGGAVHPIFETPPPQWLEPRYRGLYSILEQGDTDHDFPYPDYPFGANMAFNRAVVGTPYFDPALGRMGSNLISGEETKLFLDMHAKQQRIAYLGAMQVDHFVAASRLTKTWLLQRFYDAGRSEMRILTGYPKVRIVVRHIAKLGLDMARWCKAPFTERATIRVRTTAAFLQGCWQEFVGKA